MLIQKQFKNIIPWTSKKLDVNDNSADSEDNDESKFVLTILEKITETRLKFFQDTVL